VPQLAKVQVCSRSVAVSVGGAGLAQSFSNSSASSVRLASAACAESVSDAVQGLCAGGDPMATIYAMASTCASAMAGVYASSVSGGSALPSSAAAAALGGGGGGGGSAYPSALLAGGDGAWDGASPSTAGQRLSQHLSGAGVGARGSLLASGALLGRGSAGGGKGGAAAAAVPTAGDYLVGCGSGCSNAQAAAEAVAQAGACAFTSATQGCQAVTASLSGRAYSRAFVRSSAKAWSQACSVGAGAAFSQGLVVANTTVESLARAMGSLVATACSGCPTCRCAPLPANFTYNDLDDVSNGAASASFGRYAIARALGESTAAFCGSDGSPRALGTAVNSTISALATITADVMSRVDGGASARGVGYACGGGRVETQVQASKMAVMSALSDAGATIFGEWCPTASTKIKSMVTAVEDMVDTILKADAEACASGDGGGGIGGDDGLGVATVANKTALIERTLTTFDPLVTAIGEALNDAQNCGCKPSSCYWCNAQLDGATDQPTSSLDPPSPSPSPSPAAAAAAAPAPAAAAAPAAAPPAAAAPLGPPAPVPLPPKPAPAAAASGGAKDDGPTAEEIEAEPVNRRR